MIYRGGENVSNIYLKQMQRLGLNPKQYATLIDMPYEVVKDFIYEREGEYDMTIKELLRRNMLEKHQDVEENYQDAKLKATEIKFRNNDDKREWYEKDYSIELLLKTLHLKTRAEFGRTYEIMINGKPASKWIGYCMMSKINYDNHEVSKDIQDQYIEQLYDILVNGNRKKYLRKDSIKVSDEKSKRPPKKVDEYKNEYFKWFVDFDIKGFMKKYNLNNNDLADALNVGVCTTSYLVSKRHYTKRTLQKLYDYVNSCEGKCSTNDEMFVKMAENDELEGANVECEEPTNEKMDDSSTEIIVENDNNDILRRILANRLTDEEKELIKIFGGKI